jgi:hypothetical protein
VAPNKDVRMQQALDTGTDVVAVVDLSRTEREVERGRIASAGGDG